MSRQKGDIMRELMISIQPKWCKPICSGEKTVEVRKNRPNCELPFKCYIYCTKGKPTFSQSAFCDNVSNGKVIGEFICDRIDKGILRKSEFFDSVNITYDKTCVSLDEFENYLGTKGVLGEFEFYGWHITDLIVYDEPRELSEFEIVGCQGCRDKDTYHCKFHCFGRRRLKRPPQSWCYIEPRQTAD
jgi:predicted transcriptional regulator